MIDEFYVATLDTRHYSFEAYGESESAARAALLAGLKRHAVQVHLPRGTLRELMHDAVVRPVALGGCYRDRTLLEVQS